MAIEKGKLVRWIGNKGFGFIKPDNGHSDIFIHISGLSGSSRPPIIGDIIIYEIGSDHNGKTRAVNARIEGVQQLLTLAPVQSRPQINNPSSARATDVIYRRNTVNFGKPKKRFSLLPLLFFTIFAVYLYDKVSKEKVQIDLPKLLEVDTHPQESTPQFQCQGKIWCSQMSSSEEAVFYLNNCPGTKMDGDNDGQPCESQF